jgi:hypothetical protein
MADYYARNKHYGAAGFYCQQIQEHYPDTSFAALAASRFEEIAGLPPDPPQRMAWLSDLFEERR